MGLVTPDSWFIHLLLHARGSRFNSMATLERSAASRDAGEHSWPDLKSAQRREHFFDDLQRPVDDRKQWITGFLSQQDVQISFVKRSNGAHVEKVFYASGTIVYSNKRKNTKSEYIGPTPQRIDFRRHM